MCVAAVAWEYVQDYPLVVVSNRDEFHGRDTRRADFWESNDSVLAGRDLSRGGTWLGVSRFGRFAMVTNFREVEPEIAPDSRGELVRKFLEVDTTGEAYLNSVLERKDRYGGFNLIVFDGSELFYASNRSADGVRKLDGGLYGLSNHLLDTPWPKVERVREQTEELLSGNLVSLHDELISIMRDTERADDQHLPDTGVGLDLEKKLSSVFITGEKYGTRSTTVVAFRNDGTVEFTEQSYAPLGKIAGRNSFIFKIQ